MACLVLALLIASHWNVLVCDAHEQVPSLPSNEKLTLLPTKAKALIANLPLMEDVAFAEATTSVDTFKSSKSAEATVKTGSSPKKNASVVHAASVERDAKEERQEQLDVVVTRHLQAVPDKIVLNSMFAKELPYSLRTVYNKQLEEAGFYINEQEVFRFRSRVGFLTPYLRSKQVADRLSAYSKLPLHYQDVHLERQAEGDYHLMMGKHLLTVVDESTALAAHMPLDSLAKMWMKQLRTALGEKPAPAPSMFDLKASGRFIAKGVASWYGPGFHGRKSADGSRFNMHHMTAAHKTLPFGTKVKVINERNGKSCVVRITDRGPYSHHRVIDLSKAAAQAIGAVSSGVAKVRLEVLN
ncbi:MAG: septal ring lytic transglycosylase RlpA family protein [Vampirovibrionales bacterium]